MKSLRFVVICDNTILVLLLASSVCSIVAGRQVAIENLECIGSTLCEPAISTCYLQRCDCPASSCATSCVTNCLCCGFIPSEFYSARNVLQFEDYTPLANDSYTRRYRVTVWSKDNTANATWTTIGNQIHTYSIYDSKVPEYLSISDTFPGDSFSSIEDLSNISATAGPRLQIELDKCSNASETCNMNTFDCAELFNTTCIVKDCSCWSSSVDYSPRDDREGILLPENCAVLDKEAFTVTTSSNLSVLHNASNSINEWKNGTFGGWAPKENDTYSWTQFSDIQVNVSGVIIQGMAGDAIRSLGRFEVSNCTNTTFVSETFNHYGGIFNSFTIHYIGNYSSPIDCLKITVLEPNDTAKIGFRAGLITCNETSVDDESALHIACADALALVKTLNSTIAQSSANVPNGAEAISQTFQTVAGDLSKINKSRFAKSFHQKIPLPDIDLDLNYQQINSFKSNGGFHFNQPSILASDASFQDSTLSITVPDAVLDGFLDEDSVAFVVGQTITTNNDGPNARIKGSKGRIVSPVVTLMTLVENNYTSVDNVTMEFDFKDDNKSEMLVGSFRELEGSEWDVDGCTSVINRTTSRVAIQCNHTTSFAVILLIQGRRLPEWAEKLGKIITTGGCSISSLSLAAALVIYVIFRSKMDRYQFAIHFNLMTAIFAALVVFITMVERTEPDVLCQITKFSLQYLFLAVFFWMLCEGILLYRKIITVFETKSSHIFVFYVIGWGIPLILVAVTIGALTLMQKRDNKKDISMDVKDEGEDLKVCFLSYQDSSIWFFVVPAITIVAINTYILLRITIVVMKASKIQTQASAQKLHQAKTGIRSALLLMPLLGSTYILGLATSIDPIIELLFNLLNSLQGFFIALFYCALNSEITKAMRKALQRGQDARSILASTTAQKTGKRFKNKITTETTLIDSETMKKLQEI